ncbi:MAG: hypothetical protein RRZ24_09250 [Clostridia bacterium]
MKEAIVLTNITEYYVTDVITENLLYKAAEYGVGELLVGASSIPAIKEKAKKLGVSLSAVIAYPSGAYNPDAKAEEINELNGLYPEIDAYYAVVSLGMYLSRGIVWLNAELEALKTASGKHRLYIITEIAPLLKNKKAEEFVAACTNFHVEGIVVSTGFEPYHASFPTEADVRAFRLISGNALSLIGAGLDAKTALSTGCKKVLCGLDVENLL